ncbi:MAG TPA: DUF3263 domain-containing protein [Micromonosporaceae bacterium]
MRPAADAPDTTDVPDIADTPDASPIAEPAQPPRVPAQVRPAEPALTDRERRVLDFERRWWRHAGAKEQAIRDTFGISATRYYQLLNGLLDNPAALAVDPVLVNRLRRLRAARVRIRRR